MSKLREKRWSILKPIFEQLKNLSSDPNNAIFYDGDNYSEFFISINDEQKTCAFVLDRTWHGIFDDSEYKSRESVSKIIIEIKNRIKVYRLQNIW